MNKDALLRQAEEKQKAMEKTNETTVSQMHAGPDASAEDTTRADAAAARRAAPASSAASATTTSRERLGGGARCAPTHGVIDAPGGALPYAKICPHHPLPKGLRPC